jgi:hypothetical protein
MPDPSGTDSKRDKGRVGMEEVEQKVTKVTKVTKKELNGD